MDSPFKVPNETNTQGSQITSLPTRHTTIVVGKVYTPAVMIYCPTGATLTLADTNGTEIVYTVPEASFAPLRATCVVASNKSDIVGLF